MKSIARAHILYLTPGFARDESDCFSLPYFQNYLRALTKQHPELLITIIAFEFPYAKSEYQWHGIRVFALGGQNKKYLAKMLLWNKVRRTIFALHEANPIDVIHSLWLTECAFVGGRIASKLNIRHVCTAMGSDVLKKNKYLRLINFNQLKLITVSDFQKNQLLQSKPTLEANTIPWGIEAHEVETGSDQERSIDILGVGSLTELKNYSAFIDVVGELVKSNTQINAAIIGDGPQMSQLQKQATASNLSSVIKFLGQKTNMEVQTYMQSAKVLLHLSTFESQGYVFLEALRNGMKVVSRPLGIAEASDRWLIATDREVIIKQVAKALSDFEVKVVVPYYIENTVSAYLDIYELPKVINQ